MTTVPEAARQLARAVDAQTRPDPQEFHQIKKFVAACRRQWPGAMLVLRPNQDGAPAGASAPPTQNSHQKGPDHESGI